MIHTTPYRYVCTSCGSTKLRNRVEKQSVYCKHCNTSLSHVYDKKTGVDVSVTNV